MIIKRLNIIFVLSLFLFCFDLLGMCNSICDPASEIVENDIKNEWFKDYLKNFKPDYHITEQLPQDLLVLERMRPLFFEPQIAVLNGKKDVYTRAIKEYGAQEVMLLTKDNFRLSSLYFKRENAPLNIIYVTGYFHNDSPPKEWCAPFSQVFPNFNILSFDWRGFGGSDGLSDSILNGMIYGNDFGVNATPDIQAAIDFIKKENDKPIVLVGFCGGGAMAIKTTLEAQKTGKAIADALVLNCMFTKFENQFERAGDYAKRFYHRFLVKSGLGSWILDYMLNGSLFDLKPIDVIDQVKVPCYFEHFTSDPFAILEEGIELFEKAKTFKIFLQSDLGRHARIHSKAPYQYRESFYNFLEKSGLVKKDELEVISDKEIKGDLEILNKHKMETRGKSSNQVKNS
jgi:pimeloyl-ACP methyl ester carboxylesterase